MTSRPPLEPMAKTQRASTRPSVAPVVGNNGPAGGSPGSGRPGADATATVIKHAGNRGGKPRSDGLVPGSTEALEADREADRVRKQITRANAAAAAEPPPIVSMHAAQAPGAAVVALPGAQAGPYAGPVPPVLWTAEHLRKICDLIVGTGEEFCLGQLVAKMRKVGMPKALIEEIEKDAAWSAMTKESLNFALPELLAKWLNHFGISADYRFELMVGCAVLDIGRNQLVMIRRIELWTKTDEAKQIQQARAAVAQPAPERKAALFWT